MSEFDELKKKISESGSSTYSRKANIELTQAMLNSPDFKRKVFSKKGDTFESEEITPVKDFRDNLKDVVRTSYGINGPELSKLDTVKFNKKLAANVVSLGECVIKNTLETGKTYNLPVFSKDEACMKLQYDEVPEKKAATMKIEQQKDGTWKQVPTGKKVKTKKHTKLTVKNTVQSWLKEVID
jgi:hypothetical protein